MKKALLLSILCLYISMSHQVSAQQTTSAQRMVLVEEFTSSTCSPCADMNTWLTPLLDSNRSKCVIIKYQMSFPGSGDPYYTSEGGARKAFYGVNAVPAPFVDAVAEPYPSGKMPFTAKLNAAYNVEAKAEIIGTFLVQGSYITINTSITPSITAPTGYKIFVSVNEKVTTENKRTNGEKEFHHVMMKMFPDGAGTEANLVLGQPIPLTFNYNMSKTNVEEVDDLEVVVFVQNTTTKEILNAALLNDVTPSARPRNFTATQESIGSLNILLSWQAPDALGIKGYNIYRDGTKLNNTLFTGTAYTDTVSKYGAIYNYLVSAVFDGDIEGYGASDTAQIKVNVPVVDGLEVEQLKINELDIKISWHKPQTVFPISGYHVYRNNTKLTAVPIKDTFYATQGVSFKEYCFSVEAVVGDFRGDKSAEKCVTLLDSTQVGINEIETGFPLAIYPNPAKDIIYLQTEQTITGCKIYTVQGQLVYMDNKRVKEIPVSHLSQGIYMLHVYTQEGRINKYKIIVQ